MVRSTRCTNTSNNFATANGRSPVNYSTFLFFWGRWGSKTKIRRREFAPHGERFTVKRGSKLLKTHFTQTAANDDTGCGADEGFSRKYSAFDSKTLPSMLGLTDRIEDRHQAKRVLRRRIKPKRKRCCDRLSGPGPLFNLSRGVPKLPRGGEGLASVSLRPSLARPRRPATASYPLRAPESRRLSRHSRVRSFSAPPIVSGTREAAEQKDETILACNKTKTSDRVDLSIHGQAKTGSWERASGEEDSPTTPQPPPREKRTTFSRIATSHRTIRYSDTKSRTGARPQFIDQDCCAAVDDENHEQDSISVTTSDEHAHVLPENVRLNAEDAVVEPPPAEEKRVAAVVLSSTVLLGPRGRSRTPKELTDSPQSGGSYGGEALEERSSDRVNPSREILGRWFGQSSRYELANAPSPSGTERLVTDHETERLLANEVRFGKHSNGVLLCGTEHTQWCCFAQITDVFFHLSLDNALRHETPTDNDNWMGTTCVDLNVPTASYLVSHFAREYIARVYPHHGCDYRRTPLLFLVPCGNRVVLPVSIDDGELSLGRSSSSSGPMSTRGIER